MKSYRRRFWSVGASALLCPGAAAVLAAATACTGSIEVAGPDGKVPGAADDDVRPPDLPSSCKSIEPGPAPIRRLTRFEYDNTIRDLLGEEGRFASVEFPVEERRFGFDNNATALTVSPTLAEKYLAVAEVLSERAANKNLGRLLGGCDPTTAGEDVCARSFIENFGRRAFRRPVPPDEAAVLEQVYATARMGAEFADGIRVALTAMLISPWFLYRVEFGRPPEDGSGVVALDSWEMASRLSYLLWGSMPDDELFAAAESGGLARAEDIARQVERMFEDPRARAVTRNFHGQWLELDRLAKVEKDRTVYPEFSDSRLGFMRQETELFLDDIVWNGDGTVQAMFTADYTFANADLANFYGLSGSRTETHTRMPLRPGRGSGFLTQGSLMTLLASTNQSSPVRRGKFVRENLLCEDLPPPPPDVVVDVPEIDKESTTGERFARHRTDPACEGCHKLIDPIGLGLENFDGIGLWRDQENGKPIDGVGEIVGHEPDGRFKGPIELAHKLGESEQVRTCLRDRWFVYALGREAENGDACSLDLLDSRFRAENGSIKALLLALTATDAFLYRPTMNQGEMP